MSSEPALSAAGWGRVALALVLQPFVAAALGFVVFPVVAVSQRVLRGGSPVDPIDAARAFGLAAGIAGLFVTIAGAIPALLWMLRRRPISRRRTLVSGAVLGNLPGIIIMALVAAQLLRQDGGLRSGDVTDGAIIAVRALVVGSLMGTACAAVFWWIAGSAINVDRQTADV
jgi:hypothetical protein